MHCNEVMLLPYYVASMNIEHEYYELTGKYEPFEGICLVDTFELAEDRQMSFFIDREHGARRAAEAQRPSRSSSATRLTTSWQLNENDNNKNRKYKVMDKRVAETYAKRLKGDAVNSLSDPYVKAIRWASDRIGEEGIVAFVTNNSFIENLAFDGMRKNLEQDFDEIYVLDLGGNVRKNPKLSGTTHNVFGIQVGVSVNIFVRKRGEKGTAKIYYARMDEFWRRREKYKFLDESRHIGGVEWQALQPDEKHNWLTEGMHEEFETFIALGSKETKSATGRAEAVFSTFSNGVKSNNDAYVYSFDEDVLRQRARQMVEDYNAAVDRWKRKGAPKNIEGFITVDEKRLKWIRNTKRNLLRGKYVEFDESKIREALYRPFCKQAYFFERIFNEDIYRLPSYFPTSENGNVAICLAGMGNRMPFGCLVTNLIPSLDLAFEKAQCFPFYTYDEDGTNRRENITDWALAQFRERYGDKKISKWDIFHYVYALLHHPAYRERYAANLKRELPRVPFAPDFRKFASAGARLAELHVNYEKQKEFPLERIEKPAAALDWRVERMRLSKDKRQIIYNDFLTLSGVPPETYEYRLGNRSALEWVIDQYQLTTDRRSGITNDPNRADDPQYILRLVAQVVTVSLETVKIVNSLPSLGLRPEDAADSPAGALEQ